MTRGYGRGQITGFARLAGQAVGVIGNDCRYYAGAMTANGAQKVRRFVEICETFHIPIVSFVDEPGFMIGSASETAGTIRYGTAAVLAVADCSVPWASVVVRKSFGVAQAAHYGPDAYRAGLAVGRDGRAAGRGRRRRRLSPRDRGGGRPGGQTPGAGGKDGRAAIPGGAGGILLHA